jgi:hypothetical protein
MLHGQLVERRLIAHTPAQADGPEANLGSRAVLLAQFAQPGESVALQSIALGLQVFKGRLYVPDRTLAPPSAGSSPTNTARRTLVYISTLLQASCIPQKTLSLQASTPNEPVFRETSIWQVVYFYGSSSHLVNLRRHISERLGSYRK